MPPDLLPNFPPLAAMTDVISSAQSPSDPQGLATESQERAEIAAAMLPPRRSARASPAPGSQGRAGTPARGQLARTALPAKYSTSYGSPMTQLPDRSTVGGGGNVIKAAAEIFSKVKKDNVAAEARRRVKSQERAARAGSRGKTASPAPQLPTIQPTIEEEEVESVEQSASGDEGSEYEYDDDSQTGRRGAKKPARKTAQKRARDDEEAEALAEKERKERDARLKRERSAEARQRRYEKQAEAQAAARERAEQEALAAREAELERLAREEAAKAAMPPPPAPKITRTPASKAAPIERPGSSRSFIEESNLFRDAELKTPTPGPEDNARRSSRLAPPAPPEPPSPPSVLRRPPRRPTGTPASRTAAPPRTQKAPQQREPSVSEDEDEPQRVSPSDRRKSSTHAGRIRARLKVLPEKMDTIAEDYPESLPAVSGRGSRWFSLWSLLKLIAAAFATIHLARFAYSYVKPDLFDHPLMTVNWYGWGNWTKNVGQFFPPPILSPLGVLTNSQYDDLKGYLQKRATTTEIALDQVKQILPKVVSVRKDKKGKVLVADEFWAALKDRIEKDNDIFTLDKKSRISDKQWKAIAQRLEDAGIYRPHSNREIEGMIEKSAPAAWEKWLEKNKRKVADIVGGQGKGTSKGSDEAVISREELIEEIKERLADSKKEVEAEMASLRTEFRSIVPDLRKLASSQGMNKKEVTTLVKQMLDKEITRRLTKIGSKSAGVAVDAEFRHRTNHFSPGNNAQIDNSLTSPTYETTTPLIGSKKWLKSAKSQPQFLREKNQALTAWTDAGHCWCAGTLGTKNRTIPAVLAVRLPQFIIPQWVILEHIAASSTNDPLAMPRDVEVWAAFDEHARRERVLDWMAAKYPNDVGDKLVTQYGWAKLGAFRYEHVPENDGKFVYALPEDLWKLRAATDQVMIRAVSNYGARDHTCFYRVRMYGAVPEGMEAEKESKGWS